MRAAVLAAFSTSSVVFAFHPPPAGLLSRPSSALTVSSSSFLSTAQSRATPRFPDGTMTKPPVRFCRVKSMMMSEEDGDGPFTRKSLLEGVTKTAGVLGAGAFVQKGFFAGIPYHGSPDLTGKVNKRRFNSIGLCFYQYTSIRSTFFFFLPLFLGSRIPTRQHVRPI